MVEPAYELGAPFLPLEAYDAAFTTPHEELGRGASGVVRRAIRRSDGVGVAVKTIDLRALRVMGGFSISRLRREVEVMLGLRHPNIVELYGAYGNSDGVRLVMELVEGRELFDEILSRGKFSEVDARPIFGSLCAAVAYMHGRGVIHRDLKPENVLLRRRREVKLVDFGLSKLVASHRGGSAARTMVGTPSYLAPEIEEMKNKRREIDLDAIEEDDKSMASSDMSTTNNDNQQHDNHQVATYDSKVDAWSLGVTLYVMLIARFPVYKRDAGGLIAGVEIPPEAVSALSPQVRSLITSLLEADPAQRCSAADALKDAWLETAVATMPSLALSLARQQPSTLVGPASEPPQKKMLAASTAATTTPQQTHHPHAVFGGLASAHASLVAAAALQLPKDMRRAGLVYHERVLASRGLASKLRSTAGLVLETLDDLAFAVDEHDPRPQAALDILNNIKRWTSELGAECAVAKNQNLNSMRDLAESAGISPESLPSPLARSAAAAQASMSSSSSSRPRETDTLDLTDDEDVLELMLPVTAHYPEHSSSPPASSSPIKDLASPSIEPVLKCLAELHVVFSRMELFWSKVEVSLDAILRRNEALATLVKFADTPNLKHRFDTRLAQFRNFWASLASWQIDQHDAGGVSGGSSANLSDDDAASTRTAAA